MEGRQPHELIDTRQRSQAIAHTRKECTKNCTMAHPCGTQVQMSSNTCKVLLRLSVKRRPALSFSVAHAWRKRPRGATLWRDCQLPREPGEKVRSCWIPWRARCLPSCTLLGPWRSRNGGEIARVTDCRCWGQSWCVR